MNKILLFCTFTLLLSLHHKLSAQTDTAFWFAAPEISSGHSDKPIFLRITAVSENAQVTISKPADQNFSPVVKTIPLGVIENVNLTAYMDGLECKTPGTALSNGLFIQSSAEITAYYEINNAFNTDIFSLKGNNALGTRFFIPSQISYNNNPDYYPRPKNSFSIVATENNTSVTIIPSAKILKSDGTSYPANIPITITLQKGECWAAIAESQSKEEHLDGSIVTSNKPIAITIADDSVSEYYHGGTNGHFDDIVGDQLIPTTMIGTEYVTVRGDAIFETEKVYVLATEDNTQITVNYRNTDNSTGVYSTTLQKSETHIFSIGDKINAHIKATKPIYVLQMTGFNNEMGGAVLPAVNCTGSKSVSFVRPTAEKFYAIISTRKENIGSFTVKSGSKTFTINSANFVQVPGTNDVWYSAKIDYSNADIISGQQTTVSNSKGLFHLGIINATRCSSCSKPSGCLYGYFSNFNSIASITGQDVYCASVPATLTAAGGSVYQWNTGATTPTIAITPTVTSTYTVTVNNLLGCVDSKSIVVPVTANPILKTFNDEVCIEQAGTITATGGDSYLWNTGATSPSLTLSPTISSTYTVTAYNNKGCQDKGTAAITINPKPIISLANQFICLGKSTELVASIQTVEPSVSSSFTWNTGAKTSAIHVSPTTTTTYTVTVSNEKGCTQSKQVVVTVNPIPVSDVKDVAICLGQEAKLDATSIGANTYTWNNQKTNALITEIPTSTTTYSVTITNAFGCTATDNGVVTVHSLPEVTLQDTAICLGKSASFLALDYGVQGQNTTYQWHTGATTKLIAVSPSETTTYTVTATNTKSCSVVRTGIVVVHPTPIISVNSATICLGKIASLSVTGAYDFTWNNDKESAIILESPLKTTTYTVTATNEVGCTTVKQTVVQVNSLPAITASSDMSICDGKKATITVTGEGTYLWSNGLTSSTFEVDTVTTSIYTVTATNAYQCTSTDEVVLTVHPTPKANAGKDITICYGSNAVLTATGIGQYLWSTDSATASIIVQPMVNTTYSVSVTNSHGCSSTDEVAVYLGNQLKPSAGQDASICKGDNITIFPSGGNTYVWNTLEKTEQLTVAPLMTTVYTVTAYDKMNCSGTDQVVIKVNTPPQVEAGFSKAICIGTETILVANGANYYAWNTQTKVNYTKVSPQITTTYTVTGTDVNGCTSTDNTVVQVYALPKINAGNDTAICLGMPAILSASGGYTYTWSNQFISNHFTVSPKKTTLYSVTATDVHGCSNTDDMVVSVMALPVPQVAADTAVCEGQPAYLSASGGVTYRWSSGGVGAEQVVIPTQTSRYMVTVTDENGCSSKKGMNVRLLYAPKAITSNEVYYCSHNSAYLHADGGDSYMWSTGETTKTIAVKPELSTSYTVTVQNYAGCSDTSQVVVRLHELPVAEAGSTTTVCYMGQGMLTASGGVFYAWNTGAKTANAVISPLVDSHYTVTVTDKNGCTASDNVAVEVISLPEEPSVSDVIACLNEHSSITLSVNAPQKNRTYQWYSPEGDFLHQGTTFSVAIAAHDSATTYWVESVNSNHCASAVRVKGVIHYGLIPKVDFSIDSALAFVNQPLAITNLSTPQASIISYQWYMGDGYIDENEQPSYTYPTAGIYSIGLVVTSTDLCTDTLFKKDAMRIVDFPNLFIPTAFSPNEDSKNDYFRAYGEVTQYYMQIFNQWGVKLFETTEQYPGWDGTRYGKDQPAGNYVYQVEALGKSGEKINRHGVVTLTR